MCPLGQQWIPSLQHTAWKTTAFTRRTDHALCIKQADSYLRQRATAPFVGPLHEAAGRVFRAASLTVTHDFLLLNSTDQSGNFGYQGKRRKDTGGVVASFSLQVANRAVRTAVDVIVTTNSLQDI